LKPTLKDFLTVEFDFPERFRFNQSGFAMVAMTGGRVAKVSLKQTGINHGYLDGFVVKIIDTAGGKIDSATFRFKDFLDTDNRSDNRPDYTRQGGFYASDNGYDGVQWYIAVPEETAPLTDAVIDYIGAFTYIKEVPIENL